MGIIKNIANTIKDYYISDYAERNNLSFSLNDYQGWISAFPQYNQALKEDYQSFSYAAMNTRAEKIRETNNCLYVKQANGKKKEIQTHPFLELISSTNLYNQNFEDIKYLIALSLDLYGNAYIYYSKNIFGIPNQLILLPSNKVTIQYNSTFTNIESYIYFSGNKNIKYYPEEIIHIKLPNPDNQFVGKSTCSALRYQIDTDYYQSEYNKNFYLNDASLGVVLSTPARLSDENFERLDSQFKAKYSGYKSTGKHLILDNGMTASSLNASPKESAFIESRKANRDEIFGVFKVPKSIMGYVEDVNRSNAESMRISFIQNTIKPFGVNIETAFNTFVKINYDERLMFKLDYALQEDIEIRLKELEFLVKYGIINKNEVRKEQGYEETEEGNSYYENKSVIKNNTENE